MSGRRDRGIYTHIGILQAQAVWHVPGIWLLDRLQAQGSGANREMRRELGGYFAGTLRTKVRRTDMGAVPYRSRADREAEPHGSRTDMGAVPYGSRTDREKYEEKAIWATDCGGNFGIIAAWR